MKAPFASPILKRLAPSVGLKVDLEPEYGYAGRITLRDGTRRYFRGTCFDLNPLGASEIAKDKDYSAFFLRKLGYSVIEGQAFFSREWAKHIKSTRTPAAAWRYARSIGLPVIVKPNSLSQGSGVAMVHDYREFVQAVRSIEPRDKVFLIQKRVIGRDYRIVVLDDEVMSAYERLPLSVTGDGESTIRKLLVAKQRRFDRQGRDTKIKAEDFRITNKLRHLGLNRGSIPERGQRVQLLENCNLSAGGDAVDVTPSIHADYSGLAVGLTRDMGLRYCGVDLFVTTGDITQPRGSYVVIEINAAPGIDNYANVGRRQRDLVEAMYTRVLQAIARMSA